MEVKVEGSGAGCGAGNGIGSEEEEEEDTGEELFFDAVSGGNGCGDVRGALGLVLARHASGKANVHCSS